MEGNYIVENDTLVKVSETQYENWFSNHKSDFILPEYYQEINGNTYGLETIYMGICDKGEMPLPFILFYFEKLISITEEGISANIDNDTTEYFETFTELKQRYTELKNKVESLKIIDEMS